MKTEVDKLWNLDKSRPICPQICEQISVLIASGEIGPNQKLMSVREVALNAGVNPNTVQKAFEQLERQGLIYSVRGSGWFVSDNTATAGDAVQSLITEKTRAYFEEMRKLGCSTEKIKQLVKEWNE